MMFRRMGIGAFDLHKAFGADGLIATSSVVEVRWVVEKADGTLGSVPVERSLQRPAVDVWVTL